MSGLIALLDDVAAISKVAAASIDDVAGQAAKAGAKAAGAVIDDAAVTPKYMKGFNADRELPIVWKIARGSIFNKLVILLPVALALSALAPWAIPPLLMLGGAYLCYEGAHKVAHLFHKTDTHDSEKHIHPEGDGAALEEERVRGAIKTDFILSAEIMTIALSTIPVEDSLLMKGIILALVAVAITVAVYGFVALVVKADDIGLHLARRGSGPLRLGDSISEFMDLARESQIAMPPDMALLFKALVTADRVLLQLDPDFDVIRTAAPLVREQMRARYTPRRLLREQAHGRHQHGQWRQHTQREHRHCQQAQRRPPARMRAGRAQCRGQAQPQPQQADARPAVGEHHEQALHGGAPEGMPA